MKILITGGAGFVGSSIAIFLKQKYPSYHIVCLDNLKRRGSELNLKDLKDLNVNFIHGDIRNREDFEEVGSIDVLIEASAEPSVQAGTTGCPRGIINNNLLGSFNCFDFATKNEALVIFLSTSRVYPIELIESANFHENADSYSFSNDQSLEGISQFGISEDLSTTGSRTFYGTTKLSSELFLEEYHRFYDLKTISTRFGIIAGPRQMGKIDQGVATLWMARHFFGGELSYIGYDGLGKQFRDVLHIDDLLELVNQQIHHSSKFIGKTYNVGGGIKNSLTLKQMTILCQEITGRSINIQSIAQTKNTDLKGYVSDIRKIKEETGWEPKRNIKDTFIDIFNWIRDNEVFLKPILQ